MSNDANYYDRFANEESQPQQQKKVKKTITSETGYSLTKIFGYMFAGLMLTAVIMLGLAAVYRYYLGIVDGQVNFADETTVSNAVLSLLVLLIVSFLGIIILSIVVPITVARGKHSVLVPAILYAIFMGIALSTIAIFIPWYLLGITFGLTSLVFGLMALIALLSKGRLNGLAIAGMGLIFGAMIISLFLFVLMLLGVAVTWLYWVVSLAVFAGMMLITIWDMARIKSIAQNGALTNNLSLYCAYILYNDFIYIFLRILRIVLVVFSRNK